MFNTNQYLKIAEKAIHSENQQLYTIVLDTQTPFQMYMYPEKNEILLEQKDLVTEDAFKTDRNIVPGCIVRHFKNKNYLVIGFVTDVQTTASYVLYRALYGDNAYYLRDFQMFMSEVDHTKYPNSQQKYRFERIK